MAMHVFVLTGAVASLALIFWLIRAGLRASPPAATIPCSGGCGAEVREHESPDGKLVDWMCWKCCSKSGRTEGTPLHDFDRIIELTPAAAAQVLDLIEHPLETGPALVDLFREVQGDVMTTSKNSTDWRWDKVQVQDTSLSLRCHARNAKGAICSRMSKHDDENHLFCLKYPHEGYCSDDCFIDDANVTPATTVTALRAQAGQTAPVSPVLDAIRAAGWSVAVHNDYHLDGVLHTFWLFTKGNQCVKGEGRADAEALEIVRRGIDALDRVLERDLIDDHCRSDPPTRVKTRLAVLTHAGTLACTVVAAGLRGQRGPYSLNRVRGDHLTTDSVFVLDAVHLRELDSWHAVDVGDVHVELMRVRSEDLHEWLAASRVGG